MRKQRLWLIVAAMLLVVSVSPMLGATKGNSKVIAEQGKEAAAEAAASTEADAANKQAADQKTDTAAVQTEAAPANPAPEVGATVAEEGKEVALHPITAVKKIAENGSLIMYIDEAAGNIRIVDKKTKVEWLGAPQTPRTTMPNNKKFMDSAALVKYTEGVDVSQTYLTKEKDNKLAIEVIDNGAKVTFQFAKEKLEFAMEYRLLEDGFTVKVLGDSLKEDGTAKFVSIEPLPFWNAAAETEQGALFIPDGSGALMSYKSSHPQYFAGYSERIYGADPVYMKQTHESILDSEWRLRYAPNESIALPVFGNYRGGVGSLGIVEQGQYDAKVNGTPPGVRAISYYRTSVEFMYRWDDVIYIGNSGQIPFFQAQLIEGDRQTRYVLLQGEQADYVGMAKAYGNYLTNDQQLTAVAQNEVPLKIKLLGGLLRDEVLGKTFISMTTFDQAREIIDAFQQKGVTKLELIFSGWNQDGLYGNQPDHFPVEKKLGGAKDLKELAAYASEKGVSLYLEANYSRIYEESDGMKKSKDAIRGMDREAVESTAYYLGSKWNNDNYIFYWMKPERVVDKHVNKELDHYASLGISGVHLKYWGDTLYSDLDMKSPITREQTATTWRNAASALREAVGETSVDYGYAYMLGHVDSINDAPLDSSHYIYNDRTVPFYQIALRGLVPYSASAINLREDAQHDLLRMVEYGALPTLELTYEPTSKLQRTMEDHLWSSHYTDWLDKAVKEYEELKPIYEAIANEKIADHEQLQADVYRTTYENGTQVIVNYGSAPVVIDGTQVSALGYAMQNGVQ